MNRGLRQYRNCHLLVILCVFSLFFLLVLPSKAISQEGQDESDFSEYDTLSSQQISDPLEGFNRAMFQFNDKVYFWVAKPVAKGYGKVLPEFVRRGVRNFYKNLYYPVRLFGSLFQLKAKRAAMETFKFLTNTTLGLGGLIDYSFAFDEFNQPPEDTGQALAFYGMGHGFYIVWPFFGPMSARDTLGLGVDFIFEPVTYVHPLYMSLGLRSHEYLNDISLRIGEYEALKESSIDPYVAMRDAYFQYRAEQVKK